MGFSIGQLTTWQQTEKSQREKEQERTHRFITESSSDIPSFSLGPSHVHSHIPPKGVRCRRQELLGAVLEAVHHPGSVTVSLNSHQDHFFPIITPEFVYLTS